MLATCLGSGLAQLAPAQETVHWSQILTSRLTTHVKLVGATISCEPCWQGGNTANAKRHNAHVQSYFMATDQVSWLGTTWMHASCVTAALLLPAGDS